MLNVAFRTLIFSFALLLLGACQPMSAEKVVESSPTLDADQEAQALFEEFFDAWLARDPTFQTWLGIKDDYDKWDNLSESFVQAGYELHQQQLTRLQAIDPNQLSEPVRLSYALMEESLEERIENYRWRDHNYPVNQMFGWHSYVPSLLINQHTVNSVEDAEDYIARIENVPTLFDQLIAGLYRRAETGIIPPRFVFPLVIDDCKNVIRGAPFDEGEASPIFADFSEKIEGLDIGPEKKTALINAAEKALVADLGPAYQNLIASLRALSERADDRAGVWKFPDGEAFYNAALKKTTTTTMTADEIHRLGLQEVERIHAEMRSIKNQVGFEGDLHHFFTFLREDDQFYFPATDEGREAYLQRTQDVIDEFSAHLDKAFISEPKSPLKVKRVEAFREKSAGKAFYQSPPLDGSRPGIYYVNLYNMREMPKYQLEALVYHEGLPGHHLQRSITTELENLPRFRKYARYTAYTEGWGLYAELLPKEMGFYQDPYSDFGRLAMELWRACRLVVDTGLHAKKWTREQAIQYLIDNTPNAERDSKRAIERYIVMPSQATAYKIGMIEIVALRERAREQLGEAFDLRVFHEVVLGSGPLPLSVLESKVENWMNEAI